MNMRIDVKGSTGSSQSGDGQTLSIPVGRRMIAVARSGDAYFAIEDICTHDGAALTGGDDRRNRNHLPASRGKILPAQRVRR